MKKIILLLLGIVFLLCTTAIHKFQNNNYDVVIYGGTSSGIAAAVQSARMGMSVILIEPSQRIGGLTTGGLGQTDIGNKPVIGGIAREFYQNIKKHYEKPAHWKWQKRSEYKDGGQTRTKEGEDAMWTFEPSAALHVYKEMIALENIDLVLNERLDREKGVRKNSAEILQIIMESGKTYQGRIFIDATYEGDLMAAAGVEYSVGREDNKVYGETYNGVQLLEGHQFPDNVDPYVIPGDTGSGLLWGISSNSLADPCSGDTLVQAYNFRVCLTNNQENMIPITKPDNYDPKKYELLARLFCAQPGKRKITDYFLWNGMPNAKTDINNWGGFSTDMINMSNAYPEAGYEEREGIVKAHEEYTKGLLYFYISDPRVPEELREEMGKWGYPKDEYVENNHWSPQLYIREARRMVGEYVMTQANCVGEKVAEDVIGFAAYTMDSHNCQRIVVDGQVKNEGNVEVGGFPPYPISYRSITPKQSEVTNLLVPVCISASHIAFGSLRMEPVFMVLGQSAGAAAVLAVQKHLAVQDLPYIELQKVLLNNGQVLFR